MKTILITGAAKGIGNATAKEFAISGYNVVVSYNTSEKEAIELKNDLKEKGYEIEIVKTNIENKEEIKELVNYTISKYGKIDILVNNAGISRDKDVYRYYR